MTALTPMLSNDGVRKQAFCSQGQKIASKPADGATNANQQTPSLMKHRVPEFVSKRTVPGLTVGARTPWERLQHRLELQAEQESQRPSWCGCSGAPVHAGTPRLCMPPRLLPKHIHTRAWSSSPCTDL